MTTRRRIVPTSVEPIVAIEDTPGPNAGTDALVAHYKRLQERLATTAYDTAMWLCLWCGCDAERICSRPGTRGGQYIYCSTRCADAAAAYMRYCVARSRSGSGVPAVVEKEPSSWSPGQSAPARGDV